jgi:hypothetical protein
MNNVRKAFQILNDDQEVRCHMIFDVKIKDLRRKVRFVSV